MDAFDFLVQMGLMGQPPHHSLIGLLLYFYVLMIDFLRQVP